MKRSELLKRAYNLVRDGWAPEAKHAHGCTSEMGNPRLPAEEDTRHFSVIGALCSIAGVNHELESDQVGKALELLEQLHAPMQSQAARAIDNFTPNMPPDQWAPVQAAIAAARDAGELPLRTWLEQPERTLADVLELLGKAQQRAAHLERSGR